jgi:hypothetical protein
MAGPSHQSMSRASISIVPISIVFIIVGRGSIDDDLLAPGDDRTAHAMLLRTAAVQIRGILGC